MNSIETQVINSIESEDKLVNEKNKLFLEKEKERLETELQCLRKKESFQMSDKDILNKKIRIIETLPIPGFNFYINLL